jgi:hypothetical protein
MFYLRAFSVLPSLVKEVLSERFALDGKKLCALQFLNKVQGVYTR